MKKIAITGANGFVGSRLTGKLLARGYQVLSLVRHGANTSLLPGDADIVFVDYHGSDFAEKIAGCDVLIHGAALTRARYWNDFKKVNIDLTDKMILHANMSDSIAKLIFISSQAAAGPALDRDNPRRENDACHPVSLYGKSKMLAEKLVQDKCQKSYTIIRPAAVFGPGDRDFLFYFKLVKKHLALNIGSREKYLSLIYVDDLAELISLAVSTNRAEGEIFFAAHDESVSLTRFNAYLGECLNTFSNPVTIPAFFLDVLAILSELWASLHHNVALLNREKVRELNHHYWLVSNAKAKEYLHFAPDYDILEALHLTCKWYKEKGWL
ncbi:MAG: NAD-dependent epimerase/dehydratase family protein [Candidatus Cloacimonetes bacterium]|nr:NAD-dependent epimerase/dehydratase family protein [Candidatus Cloacimonadota bacterium]